MPPRSSTTSGKTAKPAAKTTAGKSTAEGAPVPPPASPAPKMSNPYEKAIALATLCMNSGSAQT